jgi:hypothetical protein
VDQLSGFINNRDADAYAQTRCGFEAAARKRLSIGKSKGGFCLHRQSPFKLALLRHAPASAHSLLQ